MTIWDLHWTVDLLVFLILGKLSRNFCNNDLVYYVYVSHFTKALEIGRWAIGKLETVMNFFKTTEHFDPNWVLTAIYMHWMNWLLKQTNSTASTVNYFDEPLCTQLIDRAKNVLTDFWKRFSLDCGSKHISHCTSKIERESLSTSWFIKKLINRYSELSITGLRISQKAHILISFCIWFFLVLFHCLSYLGNVFQSVLNEVQ